MKHPIFHPVEEPAAMLEMAVEVSMLEASIVGHGLTDHAWVVALPAEFVKCCARGSIRVLNATPSDVPCQVYAAVNKHAVLGVRTYHPQGLIPSSVSVHLAGRARTSPKAWEQHSLQQMLRNRQTFNNALP